MSKDPYKDNTLIRQHSLKEAAKPERRPTLNITRKSTNNDAEHLQHSEANRISLAALDITEQVDLTTPGGMQRFRSTLQRQALQHAQILKSLQAQQNDIEQSRRQVLINGKTVNDNLDRMKANQTLVDQQGGKITAPEAEIQKLQQKLKHKDSEKRNAVTETRNKCDFLSKDLTDHKNLSGRHLTEAQTRSQERDKQIKELKEKCERLEADSIKLKTTAALLDEKIRDLSDLRTKSEKVDAEYSAHKDNCVAALASAKTRTEDMQRQLEDCQKNGRPQDVTLIAELRLQLEKAERRLDERYTSMLTSSDRHSPRRGRSSPPSRSPSIANTTMSKRGAGSIHGPAPKRANRGPEEEGRPKSHSTSSATRSLKQSSFRANSRSELPTSSTFNVWSSSHQKGSSNGNQPTDDDTVVTGLQSQQHWRRPLTRPEQPRAEVSAHASREPNDRNPGAAGRTHPDDTDLEMTGVQNPPNDSGLNIARPENRLGSTDFEMPDLHDEPGADESEPTGYNGAQQPEPRKRGRPPKNAPGSQPAKAKTKARSGTQEVLADESHIKKRRGRPPRPPQAQMGTNGVERPSTAASGRSEGINEYRGLRSLANTRAKSSTQELPADQASPPNHRTQLPNKDPGGTEQLGAAASTAITGQNKDRGRQELAKPKVKSDTKVVKVDDESTVTLEDVLGRLFIHDPTAPDHRRPASEMSPAQLEFLGPALREYCEGWAYNSLATKVQSGVRCARQRALAQTNRAIQPRLDSDHPNHACEECHADNEICLLQRQGEEKPTIVPLSEDDDGDVDQDDPAAWLDDPAARLASPA